jgi:hypothetical protein
MSCFESATAGIGLGSKNTYGDGHRAGSCHYGGQSCTDGSHAVDYGGRPGTGGGQGSFTAAEAQTIANAIQSCGGQVGGASGRGENDAGQTQSGPNNGIGAPGTTHIHINVANQACGCN